MRGCSRTLQAHESRCVVQPLSLLRFAQQRRPRRRLWRSTAAIAAVLVMLSLIVQGVFS